MTEVGIEHKMRKVLRGIYELRKAMNNGYRGWWWMSRGGEDEGDEESERGVVLKFVCCSFRPPNQRPFTQLKRYRLLE